MGTQNLNNFYFNKLDSKINYSSYFDIYLASDERDYNSDVIWSNEIIDYNDGNKLPVWIDLTASTCSTQPTLNCSSQSGEPQVILSKNYWPGATSTCDCPYTGSPGGTHSAYTICDIRLTGIDNGLLTGMTTSTASTNTNCITIYDNIPTGQEFNKHYYDKRFKMHQVTASTYSPNNISYNIGSSNGIISGYHQMLNGGFYQGFWKLYGYPYEVIPTRPEVGWSMSTYLKLVPTGSTSGSCFSITDNPCLGTTTLNDVYPDNVGIFFYMGARAENKFWSSGATESGCTTFTGSCKPTGLTGDTCNGLTGYTSVNNTNCCNEQLSAVTLNPEVLPKPQSVSADTYSNSFAVRLTPDFKIGYRALRFTGSCVTTGSSTTCTTGKTFDCGYSVEESYSDTICPALITSGQCQESWIQVDVVFKRYVSLNGCDLQNMGGVNDLIRIRTDRFQRYASDDVRRCDGEYPVFTDDGYFDFTCSGSTVASWIDERDLRLGDLVFYINGRPVYTVNNFEEIIPRQLNTHKEKQVGVPFNMSWGGGSQGLYENMTFGSTGCTGNPPYQQDSNDLGLLIEKNFAGTFMGGISQFMYYLKPLTADEIYHNFEVNSERYSLFDCEICEHCDKGCVQCDAPSPSIPSECDSTTSYQWTFCSGTGTLGSIYSGYTNTPLVLDYAPGVNPIYECGRYNSQLTWEYLGSPTVGSVLKFVILGAPASVGEVCLEYVGTGTNQPTSSIQGVSFTTTVYSGGTPSQNCIDCT